jgi:hypothetical protein
MINDERIAELKATVERLKAEGDEHYRKIDERLGGIAVSLELLAKDQRRTEKSLRQFIIMASRRLRSA